MRKKVAKALRKKAGQEIAKSEATNTPENFIKIYDKVKKIYKQHKQGK